MSLFESVSDKSLVSVSSAEKAVDVAASGDATEKHEQHQSGDPARSDEWTSLHPSSRVTRASLLCS